MGPISLSAALVDVLRPQNHKRGTSGMRSSEFRSPRMLAGISVWMERYQHAFIPIERAKASHRKKLNICAGVQSSGNIRPGQTPLLCN